MARARILTIGLLLTLVAPRTAAADGLVVPFFGVNFGGDSGQELGDAADSSRFNWGASFAWMGAGVFGVEGDVGYSPDFFGKTDVGGSSVLTMTGNLLIGVPFGGQSGFGVRPYAAAGVGVVRPEGEGFPESEVLGEYRAAWDFGGGVMIFFADHVGVRGDVRYFRTFEAVDFFEVDVDTEGAGKLDFTRGSVGLILRF
jgi:hypothetical protein